MSVPIVAVFVIHVVIDAVIVIFAVLVGVTSINSINCIFIFTVAIHIAFSPHIGGLKICPLTLFV